MNPTSEPSSRPFVPFVPESSDLPELTFRAVLLGTAMAIVLGTANAYLGMRAGLTVAATFPAAVVAMAALRLFGGSILEENMARTTASVGEALVAGAIFTIPAFVISGVWDELRYWESTAIMLVGGILGVLFIILLRRTLVVEAELPYPESVAAAELVKAGQGGRQTGAKFVFQAMGVAGGWELLKNSNGIKLVADSATWFVSLGQSTIEMLGRQVNYVGGFLLQSPAASPALLGVGFIVGPQIAATLFAGAVLGWLLLVPLSLFLNPALAAGVTDSAGFIELSTEVWLRQVRPLAVGTMIVAAFYTLYNLRTSLIQGIGRALGDIGSSQTEGAGRQDIDIDVRKTLLAIVALAVPLFGLYWYFSESVGGAFLLTIMMVILGFLFAAVAGYLVGLLGSSNNPISGLTLSTLLIAAVVMVGIGVTGSGGILGVLAVAGVVCCACGISGDMLQDLKVGHILGGTPWKMQIGELIGVTVAAMVLIWPMILMDQVYEIGSPELPAPQAGLMALISQGIVGGDMAWPLVIAGMALATVLILINAPSPMLIAVGMYLPFPSTAGIFVGGLVSWWLSRSLDEQAATGEERTTATNTGVLLSSGFIAGEALMAVLLAFVVGASEAVPWLVLPQIADSALGGALIFILLYYMLVRMPLNAMRGGGQ
ncbi:MAG: oligopeptide transporter, OPT family [Acidobacteria bacterium]|nr:oligopeptide transporter, OPT family [Chloroflexota bacterium]MYN66104.1 oligopeptide transporter, OPT family [Acidobacteriota bacterium]